MWDIPVRCPFPNNPCKRVSAFLIDETMIQIGNTKSWLWIAVEPVHRVVLGVYISRHRSMLVTEHFIR